MLVLESRGCGGGRGVYLKRQRAHLCHLFKDYRIINSLCCVLAPGERSVALADNARNIDGALVCKGLYDSLAGVVLIAVLYLGLAKGPCTGYAAVERISMGGAEAGDIHSCLCPGHRIGRVGVADAAYGLKLFVEPQMCGGVSRGLELAFNNVSVHINDNHIVC